MQASARGSQNAFEEFVARYQSLIRSTIFRMGWRESDVDDLAQEVFIRVWKAAGNYRPTAKCSTWLLTITRNVVFTEGRRRQKAHLLSLDADNVSPDVAALQGREDMEPRAALEGAEVRMAVEHALAELPNNQSLALTLHRYEGLSHEEIARILGTSVPSVKSLIFRARETLREHLKLYL